MPFSFSAAMYLRIGKITSILIVATLVIGCLMIIPGARAEDNGASTVPEPRIDMEHRTAVTVDDVTIGNEIWSLMVTDGDVTIMLLARNLTDTRTDMSWVDYQSDINYRVGDNLYIAQITIMEVEFLIGGQTIPSILKTCDKIEMSYTPVKYEGGLPSFYCNITYSHIGLQQSSSVDSTFDLTLSHHIVVNLTQTNIKVEAKFDLTNTKLINSGTYGEFEAGTPFAIEIPYSMMLTLPNSHGEPITPSGHTDTSLEYDLSTSSGSPITVSKMTMNNNFTVVNQTGSYGAVGYSSMQYGPQSLVTHGFPDLVYKETVMVQSDPEITVYHNSLSGLGSILPNVNVFLVVIVVAIIVAAVGVVLVVRRRAKSK